MLSKWSWSVTCVSFSLSLGWDNRYTGLHFSRFYSILEMVNICFRSELSILPCVIFLQFLSAVDNLFIWFITKWCFFHHHKMSPSYPRVCLMNGQKAGVTHMVSPWSSVLFRAYRAVLLLWMYRFGFPMKCVTLFLALHEGYHSDCPVLNLRQGADGQSCGFSCFCP